MPSRIEKGVMEMQDVDFELVYEPGKDKQDLLDYLSQHLLLETGNDNRKDYQVDCGCRASGNININQKGDPRIQNNAEIS